MHLMNEDLRQSVVKEKVNCMAYNRHGFKTHTEHNNTAGRGFSSHSFTGQTFVCFQGHVYGILRRAIKNIKSLRELQRLKFAPESIFWRIFSPASFIAVARLRPKNRRPYAPIIRTKSPEILFLGRKRCHLPIGRIDYGCSRNPLRPRQPTNQLIQIHCSW